MAQKNRYSEKSGKFNLIQLYFLLLYKENSTDYDLFLSGAET
jgi:hypothetical protein